MCRAQHAAHAQQMIHRYGRSSNRNVCASLVCWLVQLLMIQLPSSSDCTSSASSCPVALPLRPPHSSSNMLRLCLTLAGHTLPLEICMAGSWLSPGVSSSKGIPGHLKQSHTPHPTSITSLWSILPKVPVLGDFCGVPVAKTPCSQFKGPGFSPWSGRLHPTTKDPGCCD